MSHQLGVFADDIYEAPSDISLSLQQDDILDVSDCQRVLEALMPIFQIHGLAPETCVSPFLPPLLSLSLSTSSSFFPLLLSMLPGTMHVVYM